MQRCDGVGVVAGGIERRLEVGISSEHIGARLEKHRLTGSRHIGNWNRSTLRDFAPFLEDVGRHVGRADDLEPLAVVGDARDDDARGAEDRGDMSDGRGRDFFGRRCTRKRARERKEIRVLCARRLRLVARDFQCAPCVDLVSDVDAELHHAGRGPVSSTSGW